MLPLWRASDYKTSYENDRKGPTGNVRSATDQPGHHPERVSSLPTPHPRDRSSGSDETKFHSANKRSNMLSRRDTFDPEKVLPEVQTDRPLHPARMPPQSSIYDYIPLLRFFRWSFRIIMKRASPPGEELSRRKKKHSQVAESNVPLEIILVLSRYTSCLSMPPSY
jgi:hypothetical protein